MITIDQKFESTHPPAYDDSVPNATSLEGNTQARAVSVDEAQWQDNLQRLRKKIRKYNWTKRGDEKAILGAMRDLAGSHSDPQVQAYWNQRANEFEKAPEADKKAILTHIGKGLAILIAAPFAIAGGILLAAGMALRATGNLIAGGNSSTWKN
ncbi:hypothetical protein B0H10DRAFT_2053634 [Mycena sp. CBHHK59/15]|nr:hypothetical protein B0H10DRAFT_2053634 [Mycena sp. CBHHK59/15]